jgi:(S)-citramalyl-CoA lyase
MSIQRVVRPRRSFIFSPGLKPDMFPKALACGTDIVCVELEDGIAPKDKDEARRNAIALFAEPQADDGVERIVRINCLREAFGLADVQAVLATDAPPPALMLPKVRTADEVIWLDNLLTERGHATRLHVIIETNAALEAVYDIAKASPRIDALFFGGVDMAAELRCRNAWGPLLYARSRIVHAAAGQGLDVIDVPYLDLEDPEGMRREAELVRDLGFSGKGSIHPKQIGILNEVFTPDEAAIAHARRIIKAFADADTGLVVVDGKLIEKPVLRDMHRVLSIAENGIKWVGTLACPAMVTHRRSIAI